VGSAAELRTKGELRGSLTGDTFDRLLSALDANREHAAERYEQLRRTLVRFFEWRGAPFPEDHADDTFDRVARRLGEGVAVANIGAYTYTVAKLVLLETRKGPESRRVVGDGTVAVTPAPPELGADPTDARLTCLERCLDGLPQESRALILEYYREDRRERIAARRALAARLGINGEALANRAQRLRDRLQACVQRCVGTVDAT
jgi:DNA-directed RNA polymerase specialized sigma24 family protein